MQAILPMLFHHRRVLKTEKVRKVIKHSQNGFPFKASFGRRSKDCLVFCEDPGCCSPYRPADREAVIRASSQKPSAVATLEDLQVPVKHGIIGGISWYWHRHDGRLVREGRDFSEPSVALPSMNCRPEHFVNLIHLWVT